MSKLLKKTILVAIAVCFAIKSFPISSVAAKAGQFSVSPMHQLITLTPGETYVGNFTIFYTVKNDIMDITHLIYSVRNFDNLI